MFSSMYVDTEYILENIPDYLSAQDKLDELSIEWQKDIEAKFKEMFEGNKDISEIG